MMPLESEVDFIILYPIALPPVVSAMHAPPLQPISSGGGGGGVVFTLMERWFVCLLCTEAAQESRFLKSITPAISKGRDATPAPN